jgi:hemerythrin-like metal-binding protein
MEHTWSPELETGHHNIDNQHQELFQLVSMLDKALSSNPRQEIEKIVVFLEHYVETHFAEEEELMMSHDFEGYTLHKDDHEIFKARVFSLRHDLDAGLPDSRLFFAIRMFIDKLVYHIKTIDIHISELGHHD